MINLENTKDKTLYFEKASTIVVVSENLSGHRIQYLKKLIAETKLSGSQVLVLLRSEIYQGLTKNQIDDVQNLDFYVIEMCGSVRSTIQIANEIKTLIKGCHFICWDADNWLISLFYRKPKIKYLFLRPFLASKSPRSILFFFIKWVAIFYLVASSRHQVRLLCVPYYSPKLFPSIWVDDQVLVKRSSTEDLAEKSIQIRDTDIKSHPKTILIPGFISERKNPQIMLNVIAELNAVAPNVFQLVFAGQSDLHSRKMITNSGLINVALHDGFLRDDDYLATLQSAFLIVLPYANRGSSGIALECLALGKRVVLPKDRIWLEASKVSGGMLSLVDLNVKSLTRTILALSDQEELVHAFASDRRTRPKVNDYFFENHCNHLEG
jgi:glycosyltransferase involved in cell wall biosynthesis